MHHESGKQAGIAALLYVVMLTMLVLLATGLVGRKLGIESKSMADLHRLQEMAQIKNRLKLFAMLSSELYITDTAGQPESVNKEVSPGYLPCPADNAGVVSGSCASPRQLSPLNKTTGFVFGRLPYAIKSRNFYISNHWSDYFYAVDERFVSSNQSYFHNYEKAVSDGIEADVSESTGSVVSVIFPVNTAFDIHDNYGIDVSDPSFEIYSSSNIQYSTTFANYLDSSEANEFLPYLNIDLNDAAENIAGEKSSYVFLVIWPGPDGQLNSENADGDDTFSNTGDDVVVGLSFYEWKQLMANRICDQAAFLNYTTRNRKHWFQPYDSKLNKSGRNWLYSTDAVEYKTHYSDDDRYFLCSRKYRK